MANYQDTIILRDKVSKTIIKISQGFQKFDDQIGKTTKLLERFEERTKNLKKVGENVRGVGKAFTVGVTLPVLAMGAAMVKAAGEMEAMQQQLSTMLGSEVAGAKMFDEIKQMAAKTPFGTKELMQATNTMLGFGIAQEKAIPLMYSNSTIISSNALLLPTAKHILVAIKEVLLQVPITYYILSGNTFVPQNFSLNISWLKRTSFFIRSVKMPIFIINNICK